MVLDVTGRSRSRSKLGGRKAIRRAVGGSRVRTDLLVESCLFAGSVGVFGETPILYFPNAILK